jgi:hypothetical protein
MPLTPEQRQELQELEELEALEQKYGNKAPTQAAPQEAPGAWQKFKNFAGALGDAGTNMATFGYMPEIVGAREALTGGDYTAARDAHKHESADLQSKSRLGTIVGTAAGAVPSMLTGGAGLAHLLKGAGMVGRLAGAAGQGAITGGLYNPGSADGVVDPIQAKERLENAERGAKFGLMAGAAGEAIAKGAKAVGWGTKRVGRAATRTSPEQAEAYSKNAQLADDMADMAKNRPAEMEAMARKQTKQALRTLRERSTAPAARELNQRMAGQTFRVKPGQFQGTSAGEEINRSWKTSPKGSVELEVPVMEKHAVQATPVKAEMKLGPAVEQHAPHTGYGTAPSAQVSTVNRSIQKAGDATTLDELFVPAGTQKVQASTPVPQDLSVTGPQLLRAKRASGVAMEANKAKNPMGYTASNDAEFQAMDNLRRAMRDADSRTAAEMAKTQQARGLNPAQSRTPLEKLDETVEQNSRITRELKQMPNSSRIYQSGETIGNVPIRSVQQHLDRATGSEFEKLSKALDAGQAVSRPGSGLVDEALRIAGRSALRNADKVSSTLGAGAKIGEAPTLQSILQMISEANRKK